MASSGCRRTKADRSAASFSHVVAISRSWSFCGPARVVFASARHSSACRRYSDAFFTMMSPVRTHPSYNRDAVFGFLCCRGAGVVEHRLASLAFDVIAEQSRPSPPTCRLSKAPTTFRAAPAALFFGST
jgi:hypothetical protein